MLLIGLNGNHLMLSGRDRNNGEKNSSWSGQSSDCEED